MICAVGGRHNHLECALVEKMGWILTEDMLGRTWGPMRNYDVIDNLVGVSAY